MNPGGDIDLRLLTYYLTVADELHFTRAARLLFVSQPALSNQIQRLEKQLGVPLFDRTSRGVTLTEAGHAFLPHARQAVAAIRAGIAAVAPQPLLRVDVLDAELALPREVVKRLRAAHRDLRLVVTAEGSVSQRRRILAGQLDVGFCGLGAVADDELVVRAVRDEPVDLIVADGHRLSAAPGAALADVAGEVFYLPHETLAPEWTAFVTAACHTAGFEPARYPVSTTSAASALELVAEGECVTLSLRSTPLPAGTTRLPLVPELTYPWAMIWHRDRAEDIALRWLRAATDRTPPA